MLYLLIVFYTRARKSLNVMERMLKKDFFLFWFVWKTRMTGNLKRGGTHQKTAPIKLTGPLTCLGFWPKCISGVLTGRCTPFKRIFRDPTPWMKCLAFPCIAIFPVHIRCSDFFSHISTALLALMFKPGNLSFLPAGVLLLISCLAVIKSQNWWWTAAKNYIMTTW